MTLEQASIDFGSLEQNVGILSYFDRFTNDCADSLPSFSYHFDDENLHALRAKYNLGDIVQAESGIEAVCRLMRWIHEQLTPGGSPEIEASALAILEHARTAGNTGFSCDQYAVSLAECCLSVGIPARITNLEPFNPNQGGNHVAVTAWDTTLRKWFFADAQYCTCYFDSEKQALDPIEIRDALVKHHPLYPSTTFDYYNYWMEDVYRIFIARNIFSIASPARNGAGPLTADAERIYLHPQGYDAIYRALKNQKWYAYKAGSDKTGFYISDTEYDEFERAIGQWHIGTSVEPFIAAPNT